MVWYDAERFGSVRRVIIRRLVGVICVGVCVALFAAGNVIKRVFARMSDVDVIAFKERDMGLRNFWQIAEHAVW